MPDCFEAHAPCTEMHKRTTMHIRHANTNIARTHATQALCTRTHAHTHTRSLPACLSACLKYETYKTKPQKCLQRHRQSLQTLTRRHTQHGHTDTRTEQTDRLTQAVHTHTTWCTHTHPTNKQPSSKPTPLVGWLVDWLVDWLIG